MEQLEFSERRLVPFRKARAAAVREYVGRYYGGNDDGKQRPLNLIHQATSVLIPHLVSPKTRFKVRPKNNIALALESEALGMRLNLLAEEIRLAYMFRRAVMDAVLGPHAICKVGIRAGYDAVKINGRQFNLGQPYASLVDLDDWAIDPAARLYDERYWEANRYRVPRQVALDSGIFDAQEIERLPSIHSRMQLGDVEQLGYGGENLRERFDMLDLIELWDVVLYDDDVSYCVTLPGDQQAGVRDYLRVDEHQGPEKGPYHRLTFQEVPNNAMGMPLVAVWQDLAQTLNSVAAKVLRQAANSKNVLAYSRAHHEEAMSVIDAPDMGSVAVDDVNQLKMLPINGIMPDLTGFLGVGMNWWNAQSGQSMQLAGQADGDTATEIQAEQANLSVRVRDLQALNGDFQEMVGRGLGFWLDTDPLMKFQGIRRLPGGEQFEVRFDAATKEGEWHERTYAIEPFNLHASDPQVRAKRIVELFGTVVPALLQAHATTGGMLDFPTALRVVGRELDMTELDEISRDPITQAINMQLSQGAQPGMGQVAGQTSQLGPGGRMQLQPSQGPGAGAGAMSVIQSQAQPTAARVA